MKNKGTRIDNVIAYLQKRQSEGYTHVAVETPDKHYDSTVYYNEVSRKDEGVLLIGASCRCCTDCKKYYQNGEKIDESK